MEQLTVLLKSLRNISTLPMYKLFSFQNLGQKFSVEIHHDLKFEVILQNEVVLKIIQKDIKSKKIGFRLSKQKYIQTHSFFCRDTPLLLTWIKKLSGLINQLGFHNQFKAIRRLGKGQFATVFEVEKLETEERFAVKAFSKAHLLKTNKGVQALINEIKILRSFEHENLQKIYGIFESQNSIYIVSQLLRGGSLFQRLQKIYKQKKTIEPQQIKIFMNGVLSGLATLNEKKIVHRDLKLDNIMLRNNESFEPVIIDFGLATFVDEQQYLYYRCGTPGYVSPEVMNSTKGQKVTPISDVFSMGSIFHHLLTSKPLFGGQTPTQVFQSNKQFITNWDSEIYSQLTLQSLNLLKSMLQVNKDERVSAQQALVSDYFNVVKENQSPVSTRSYETSKSLGQYLSF